MEAKAVSPLMERIVAGIVLAMAFLVMGSIFVPQHSEADDGHAGESSHQPLDHPSEAKPHAPDTTDHDHSTDPHEGLPSLGSLDDGCYTIFIYGSQTEPLYTVRSNANGEELATLLRAEQLAKFFPDIKLPHRAGETKQLMYVDPTTDQH